MCPGALRPSRRRRRRPVSAAGSGASTDTKRRPVTDYEEEACLCGRERRFLEALLERARRDAYGNSAVWPADAGVHSPDVVRDVLERVVAECGEGVDLQGVDCEEPPCIGVFRLGEGDSQAFRVQTCEPWIEAYDGSAAMSTRGVTCGDERVPMLLIAPPWPLEELSPELDPQDYHKRLMHRWDVLAEAACP